MVFERKSSTRPTTMDMVKRNTLIKETSLLGTHKITYRRHHDWDFEGFTASAPIDVDLAMPPHRPKYQPEGHRSSMLISSESGEVSVRVCRHCLHRPFNLQILGTTSDVTVYVPSNFQGYISYANTSSTPTPPLSSITTTSSHANPSPSPIRSSPAFTSRVLPNAQVNVPVPRDWNGDQITVATGGSITFKVWDVFEKRAEEGAGKGWRVGRKGGEGWRKVFRVGSHSEKRMGGGEVLPVGLSWDRRTPSPPTTPTWNWDFLLEDDEDE